jgi:diguanylate cyclase (GGDEF)-like protein
MRILVVEDDQLTAQTLNTILAHQNYVVELAGNGELAWNLVESFPFDLVLLDVMIPQLDGVSLCRRIRNQGYTMPILLLTGRDSSHDKTVGLDAGADDYVVKPFDPDELAARIRALLRRGTVVAQPVLEWGALQLDPSACEVQYDGKLLPLTPKEYSLLELFLRNSNRVFSCGVILEQLWSFEETPGEEAVRTHIKGLRQKLKAAGAPADVIETVYGIGYRLKPHKPQPASSQSASSQSATKQSSQTSSGGKSKGKHAPSTAATQSARDEGPSSGQSAPLDNVITPTHQQTTAAIAAVWQRFKGRVHEQIAILERAVTALVEGQLDNSLRQQAEQEAHSLAGSLGTFGFSKGSQLARQIEQGLRASSTSSNDGNQLQTWVVALLQEIDQPAPDRQSEQSEQLARQSAPPNGTAKTISTDLDPEVNLDPGAKPVTAFMAQSEASSEAQSKESEQSEKPVLLIVDGDRALVNQILTAAGPWGFQVKTATSLKLARQSIAHQIPSLVLFDPAISRSPEDSMALLTELNQHQPPIPVLVFTAHTDLSDRLEVARLGGRAFLPKPASPELVMDAINQVLHQVEQTSTTIAPEARIMAVDDDPKTLTILQTMLEPWGFEVITLSDPRHFWEKLEATQPDLLILDIRMPHISGLELCQVVRSDSNWGGLPILFLTAHTDATTIHRVFSVGADDFVSKPIVGPELITRLINRLDRMRYLRQLAETDPLTRIANRHKSTQDIDRLLLTAQKQHQTVCLAVLDLDYFRRINSQYGHALGDGILHHLGQLLRQEFNSHDVIGRWGGEEFVLAMPDTRLSDGMRRLERVLIQLRQHNFASASNQSLHVTFSAGIAQFPDHGTDLQSLYQQADTAMYQAKQTGRDRILPAGEF